MIDRCRIFCFVDMVVCGFLYRSFVFRVLFFFFSSRFFGVVFFLDRVSYEVMWGGVFFAISFLGVVVFIVYR